VTSTLLESRSAFDIPWTEPSGTVRSKSTSRGSDLDRTCNAVLSYTTGTSRLTDDLTILHEETAGSDQPIAENLADRVEQEGRCNGCYVRSCVSPAISWRFGIRFVAVLHKRASWLTFAHMSASDNGYLSLDCCRGHAASGPCLRQSDSD
jgi:hypothetical protein